MELTDKRFCVYIYKDLHGVVRYVGQGSKRRVISKDKSSLVRELIETDGLNFEILHQDLTKEEAVNLENSYLIDYRDGKFPEWNLLNIAGPQKIREYVYEYFNQYLYLDITSPSGLRWKVDMYSGESYKKLQKRSGDYAGSLDASGYYVIGLNKRKLQAHRIVWVLHNKRDLSTNLVINHIDCCRANNNPTNLEAVTPRINNIKTSGRKDNTSGLVGIRWEPENNCWKAAMQICGKTHYKRFRLRDYIDSDNALSEAIKFRKELEVLALGGQP